MDSRVRTHKPRPSRLEALVLTQPTIKLPLIAVVLDDSLLRHGVLAALAYLRGSVRVVVDPTGAHFSQADIVIADHEDAAQSAPHVIAVSCRTTPTDLLIPLRSALADLEMPTTPALSERELEVLALVAQGTSVGDIAKACFMAPDTTKTHLSRIYRKLGVKDRAAAVFVAVSLGILPTID